ncbi:MAG: Gfo/Idh/MocA family oxidoreductase [Chloroflexi bacterium]|nr:Gfo/Idh/MocA family oxidoreductase [Chloroflexota bacterium]
MEKVRMAVIGAGWWGTAAHIPAIKQHPLAELVAVQARTLDKAQKIATDFGVPRACTSIDEVLAIEGLQAVVVSTTPNVHYEQTRAALERGLHIVIEKPMTITVAEAQALVDLADQKGLQLVISCPWHYNAHAIEARRLVESGALGRMKMVSLLMTNNVAGLYQGLPWDKAHRVDREKHPERLPYRMPGQASYSDPAVAGGGHIYTQISHVAAFLGFLTHADPVEVFARFDNAGTHVDVYDAIDARLADGTLVTIASHGLPMPGDSRFEIRAFGDRGALSLDLVKGTLEFHDIEGNAQRYPDIPAGERYLLRKPAQNLVDTILGQASNGSPAIFGLYAMKIIEAASKSASTCQNIRVSQLGGV